MSDMQISEKQMALKDVLAMMIQRIDALDGMVSEVTGRVGALETTIQKELIEPISQGIDEENYNFFQDRYGDRLKGFSENAKAIEGDDYDFIRDVYEQSKNVPPEQMEDYINQIAETVGNQIKQLKRRLGLRDDAEIEIKSDGESTEINVDGQTVASDTDTNATGNNETTPDNNNNNAEVPIGEVSDEEAKEISEMADEALDEDAERENIVKREREKDKAKEDARRARRDKILSKNK